MEKVYKSRVARWYLWTCIGMAALFAGSIVLCFKSTWILLIDVVFVGLAVVLMFDMLYHTDYTIGDGKLYIRCGVLFRMTLPVSRIEEITHKSTILSSPAHRSALRPQELGLYIARGPGRFHRRAQSDKPGNKGKLNRGTLFPVDKP